MGTLQLPQGTRAVVQYAGPRPEATHQVEYWWRRDHRKENDELLGRVSCCWNDTTDHRRVQHLTTRLYLSLCADWHRLRVDTRPLEERMPERHTLTDLQRFRRKMAMVLRAYEEEKAKALRGELGLPELAVERLELELQEAWAKAERIYGCRREDFNTNNLNDHGHEHQP